MMVNLCSEELQTCAGTHSTAGIQALSCSTLAPPTLRSAAHRSWLIIAAQNNPKSCLCIPISQLETLQSRLLDVGTAVATPSQRSSDHKLKLAEFDASATAQLEVWIDDMTAQLPPLRNFILPSGGQAAALLHLARSVCRRAERSVVSLVRAEAIDSQARCSLRLFLWL